MLSIQLIRENPDEVRRGLARRGADDTVPDPSLGDFQWVDEASLRANQPLELATCGVAVAIAEDVRLLAIKAIEAARQAPGAEF